MDEDTVTADDANAFWAALTESERSVLHDIDAREHDQALLAKLTQHGMLFSAADDGDMRTETAAQAMGAPQRRAVDLMCSHRLARELVRVLDRNGDV